MNMRYAEYKKEDLLLVKQNETRENYSDPFALENEMTEDEKREFLLDYDPYAEETIAEVKKFVEAFNNNEIKEKGYKEVNLTSAKGWINRNNCENISIKNGKYSYDNKEVSFTLFGNEHRSNCIWSLSTAVDIDINKEFHSLLYRLCNAELDYKKRIERETYEREHAEAIRVGSSLYRIQDKIRISVPTGMEFNNWGEKDVKTYSRDSLSCSFNSERVISFNNDHEVFDLEGNPLTTEQCQELEKLCLEFGNKIKDLSQRFEAKAKAIVEGKEW